MSAKVVMANDQGAVELAAKMKKHLEDRGYEVNYLGIDHEESIDYPDQAEKCCNEYLKGGYEFGVVLCGTGIGISMAANKIKGIRCALVQDKYSSEKAKQHNNANVLVMPARFIPFETAVKIADAWLDTSFEGGRHQRRIDKIPCPPIQ